MLYQPHMLIVTLYCEIYLQLFFKLATKSFFYGKK